MNTAIEIKNNIWWVGANDRRTHRFENYWPLPKGVAYNAYVVKDEKSPSSTPSSKVFSTTTSKT